MGKKVKEDKKPPPDDVVCTLYLVVLSCFNTQNCFQFNCQSKGIHDPPTFLLL